MLNDGGFYVDKSVALSQFMVMLFALFIGPVTLNTGSRAHMESCSSYLPAIGIPKSR